jgi:hypothetical protein
MKTIKTQPIEILLVWEGIHGQLSSRYRKSFVRNKITQSLCEYHINDIQDVLIHSDAKYLKDILKFLVEKPLLPKIQSGDFLPPARPKRRKPSQVKKVEIQTPTKWVPENDIVEPKPLPVYLCGYWRVHPEGEICACMAA